VRAAAAGRTYVTPHTLGARLVTVSSQPSTVPDDHADEEPGARDRLDVRDHRIDAIAGGVAGARQGAARAPGSWLGAPHPTNSSDEICRTF
jgi:hypothetical protein